MERGDMEDDRPEPGAQETPIARADGILRQDIANEMGRLYKEHYGKGPLTCRTYMQRELVVVVLSGGYTAAEQTLFEAGKWYEVRLTRQLWQDSMKARFVDKIEELTGRKVKAFMSANHQGPDLAVEMFVLDSDNEPEDETPADLGYVTGHVLERITEQLRASNSTERGHSRVT